MKVKFSAVAFVSMLLLAVIVTGCAGAEQPAASAQEEAPVAAEEEAPTAAEEEAPAAAEEEAPAEDTRTGVVLRFASWNSGGFIYENYTRMAEEFVAQDARVDDIVFEFQPFSRYNDVINVQLAAGDPPNIIWLKERFAPFYIGAGHLRPIGDELKAIEGYEFDDLSEAAKSNWTADGKLYGITASNSPNVYYINLDIFEAAGLPNPEELLEKDEWTWEFVKEASKQIVDSGAGRHGIIMTNNVLDGWNFMQDILEQYDAQPWNEDGTVCGFNSPEFIEAATLVHEMIFVDGSHPEPGEEADFFAGDVGILQARPSQGPNLEGVPYNWTIMPHPNGPAGYNPAVGSFGLVIMDATENADIAVEFLAFITNRDNSIAMSNAFPSARLSTHNVETLGPVNPIFSDKQIESAIVRAISSPNAKYEYQHKTWGPIDNQVKLVLDKEFWIPDADIPAAMDNVCKNIEPLLK